MIVLLTGGSKCGKSSLGEQLLQQFSGKKYYLATMEPFGAEGERVVNRHRKMRAGKGFETIEQYTRICQAQVAPGSGALLDCVGNLCANEMFSPDGQSRDGDVAERILADICQLAEKCSLLVLVTNQVGADGVLYAETTMDYIRTLGKLNQLLAEKADRVVELVYGIPVVWKDNGEAQKFFEVPASIE